MKVNNKKQKFQVISLFAIIFLTIVSVYTLIEASKISVAEIEKENEYFENNKGYYNLDINNEGEIKSHLEPLKDQEIKLLFFGDIMLDRNVGAKIEKQGLDSLLSKLNENKFTSNYDFVHANLEGAVTENGSHYKPDNLYDFAFAPELIKELQNYNFNLFTLSNNHLSDQGQQGINETYKYLSELGYNYYGCKDTFLSNEDNLIEVDLAGDNYKQEILNDNNCSAISVNYKNKKISFISFSMVYGMVNENELLGLIKTAQQVSDWVIISPHWGIEYESVARTNIVALAHKMIDSGADAITGHHPHVIQNYEVYKDKPIFYSLGNFIFDQYFSKETQEGLAVELNLKENEIDFTVYKIQTQASKVIEINRLEN